MQLNTNQRGSVTVFVSLILIPCIAFSGMLVDGARMYGAQQVLAQASENAVDAVLANYSGYLKDVYGLFAVAPDEVAQLESTVQRYMQVGLDADQSIGSGNAATQQGRAPYSIGGSTPDYFNVYSLTEVSTHLNDGNGLSSAPNPMYTLANPQILKNQILEYAKYRVVSDVVENLLAPTQAIAEQMKTFNADRKILEEAEKTAGLVHKQLTHAYEVLTDAMEAHDTFFEGQTTGGSGAGTFYRAISKVVKGFVDEIMSDSARLRQLKAAKSDALDAGEIQRLDKEIAVIEAAFAKQTHTTDLKRAMTEHTSPLYEDALKDLAAAVATYNKKIETCIATINQLEASNKEATGTINAQIGATITEQIGQYRTGDLITTLDFTAGIAQLADYNKQLMVAYSDAIVKRAERVAKEARAGGYEDVTHQAIVAEIVDVSKHPVDAIVLTKQYNLPDLIYLNNKQQSTSAILEMVEVYEHIKPRTTAHDGGVWDVLKAVMTTLGEMVGDLFSLPEKHQIEAFNRAIPDALVKGLGIPTSDVKAKWPEQQHDDIGMMASLGGLLGNTLSFAEKMVEKLMLLAYAGDMFSNITTKIGTDADGVVDYMMSGHAFTEDLNYLLNSEQEYLYVGTPLASLNLTGTNASIFTLRYVLNLVFTMTNAPLNSEINAAALGLCAIIPFAQPVVSILLRAIVTLVETMIDMNQLIAGHHVPFLKMKREEWTFSVNTILKGGLEGATKEQVKTQLQPYTSPEAWTKIIKESHNTSNAAKDGQSYQDYLSILLMVFTEEKDLLGRIGNLIELNMNILYQGTRHLQNLEGFDLAKAYSYIKLEAVAKMRFMFMPLPFVNQFVKDKEGTKGYGIGYTTIRGY